MPASIGWRPGVIGARATQKALLLALLEPAARLREFEQQGDATSRLALLEESKSLPFAEVWNEFCRRQDVPTGFAWMQAIKKHEQAVLAART